MAEEILIPLRQAEIVVVGLPLTVLPLDFWCRSDYAMTR